MKKTVWIFLLAVLLPSAVLGWLALRSAEEQQIVYERRTAELYQKETESLAASVREAVESERRSFGDTVHKLLARGDANALARDFTNTLADAWGRRAVGFALGPDGRLLSPTNAGAAKNAGWRKFLLENSSFLCSTEPAQVYYVPVEAQGKVVSRAGGRGGYASNTNIANNATSQQMELSANVGQSQPALQRLNSDKQSGGRQIAQPSADIVQKQEAPAPNPVIVIEGKDGGEKNRAITITGRGTLDTAGGAVADLKKNAADRDGALAFVQPKRDAIAGELAAAKPEPAPAPAKASIPPSAPVAPAMEAQPEAAKSQAPAARFGNGKLENPSPAEKPASAAAPVNGVKNVAEKTRALNDDAFKSETKRTAKDTAREVDELREKRSDGNARLEFDSSKEKQDAPSDKRAQASADSVKPAAGPEAPVGQMAVMAKSEAKPLNRKVEPQQVIVSHDSNWSTILPSTSDFQTLTRSGDEGTVSRFVQDKLDLVFWLRPPEAPEIIFGCLIDAAELRTLWPALFAEVQDYDRSGGRPPFVLALLDDKARPMASHLNGSSVRDWKRPFVSSEIGEVLPHWEAALYLASPTALADTARGLRRTLSFTIAGMVALIALGGWLVVADARRQLALAQKKTDFVSNVSHELKTPLTSIRMFAELMHDRPPAAEKQGQYLRIISVEAERLTRLINNVLDFAKLERRQKRFEKKPFDFHAVIERVWESQSLHLRESGFTTRWEAAPPPYAVVGDDDALSQILVNLLSNAEKYSTGRKEIEMHSWLADDFVNVSVLDRGMGVPDGEEQKIYEAFYRAHDSLSSGIQGSGLGLTLAQRMAREHGGEILFERREGGGSRFTLHIPISNHSD